MPMVSMCRSRCRIHDTARSPRWRTRQCMRAVVPRAAIISRSVLLSNCGSYSSGMMLDSSVARAVRKRKGEIPREWDRYKRETGRERERERRQDRVNKRLSSGRHYMSLSTMQGPKTLNHTDKTKTHTLTHTHTHRLTHREAGTLELGIK